MILSITLLIKLLYNYFLVYLMENYYGYFIKYTIIRLYILVLQIFLGNSSLRLNGFSNLP